MKEKPLVQFVMEQSLRAFEQRGIYAFRKFLRRNSEIKDWLVASDYNLRSKDRPTDVYAFTIMPLEQNLVSKIDYLSEVFKADFKNVRRVESKAKGFFHQRNAAFSICWVVHKSSSALWRENETPLDVARRSVSETLAYLEL